MRALGGLCIALLCTVGLYAQQRSGGVGIRSGGAGSHPASHASRGPDSFYHYPGRPAYGYPVYIYPYVGAYAPFGYDYSGYSYGYGGYGDQSAAVQQQPNTTVVYPPQSAPANPVIINVGSPGQNGPPSSSAPPESSYRGPEQQPQEEPAAEATHYLIALKDHTIYSAVAYWVDGSTLHYFTTGNTHNQISVSLVDRELTERLNKGTGLEVKLPPAK